MSASFLLRHRSQVRAKAHYPARSYGAVRSVYCAHNRERVNCSLFVVTPSSGQAMADLSSRQLRAVLTIAEKANISRAAAELSMSQPALGRSVNQIEKMLCVQLFDRSSTGPD
jgi:hypothetical protein